MQRDTCISAAAEDIPFPARTIFLATFLGGKSLFLRDYMLRSHWVPRTVRVKEWVLCSLVSKGEKK